MTFYACVMIRPKTDQSTVKGLSGFKIEVTVELGTIIEFLMSMVLNYLSDCGGRRKELVI